MKNFGKKSVSALGLATLSLSTVQAGYFDTLQPDDTATGTAVENFAGTEWVSGINRPTAASMNNILKSLKYLKNNGGGKFVDGTDTADAVFTGGNVGIGTDDPHFILDINDGVSKFWFTDLSGRALMGISGNDSNVFALQADSGLDDSLNQIYFNFKAQDEGAAFQGAVITAIKDTNGATLSDVGTSLRFKTKTVGAASASPKMVILGDGGVGIGTTAPTEKLEINGNVKIGNDNDTCDVTHEGSMRYKGDATTNGGDFQGCIMTDGRATTGDATDDVYEWKSITGVVQ